jgi:2-oxoglutarate dehydrogenase E2 component (dihydrolipoamide succinyltransferase)
MAVELTVPALGESITEAVVGKWHKKVGEAVKADEPLVVLETDKVTVDVPAPADGALAAILHREGDKVRVGEVLGSIDAAASGTAPEKKAKPLPPPPPPPSPERGKAPVEAGNGRGALVTPVARKVAEDRGVDPEQIKGSGAQGRVLKDDVLGAKSSPPPPPPAPRTTGPREERVRMTPLRRKVAERLLAAQANAAILTTFNEADMSAVIALRKQYQEKFLARHGVKLGFMSFFVRASVEALRAFPQVNAEIDGEDVIFKHYFDIGVAVSGSRGLVVPVVRNADQLSMGEIEKQIGSLSEKARGDKLTLDDLKGGTFTISNGGIFGSMMSTPILNPPQTGILGMHAINDRPVARDGQVVIRPMMYLALSYDHRLVDGREAVQFLVRVKEGIEDPQRLLLEV